LLVKNTNDLINDNKDKDAENKAKKIKSDFQNTERLYKIHYESLVKKNKELNEHLRVCLEKFKAFDNNLIFIAEEVILKFCVNNQEIAQNTQYENENIKKVTQII